MQTDLTFFTIEPGCTPLDRFKATLNDTLYFDILVGYFRSSGFFHLYENIKPAEKVRILVGLEIEELSYKTIHAYHSQTLVDSESQQNDTSYI